MQNLNKLRIFPIAWWMIWITFHTLFLVYSGWSREIAIADSLISNLSLAAVSSGVLFSVQYNRPEAKRMAVLFAGIILTSLLWVWLTGEILAELFTGNESYIDFLRSGSIVRFLTGFFMITLFALIGWITYFVREQIDDRHRSDEALKLAKESELIHLRQQLQPHFLFNTLNSVNALIGTDPGAAKKMIIQLSEFLRGTLKKEDNLFVTLKEELDYLQLYLEIEKVRFGNRLVTTVSLDPHAGEMKIPVFLLQPLVENAIKFGLYDTIDAVEILITACYERPNLIISISNPFDADTAGTIHGTGFGLSAVSRRLFLLFNRNDLLEVISSGNKFTAVLKIPQFNA